jgi:hypothetical protein
MTDEAAESRGLAADGFRTAASHFRPITSGGRTAASAGARKHRRLRRRARTHRRLRRRLAPPGRCSPRDQADRPTRGRYIAGVCGALGRATNTDPVLWRVVLAVLGFFGGRSAC